MLSEPNFHLKPCNATETVEILFNPRFAFINFTADQSLVFINLEYLNSSTITYDIPITVSHCNQSFFIVEEVDTDDLDFIIMDDDFYFGYFLTRVENVTLSEIFCSSHARRAISKSETEGTKRIPRNLCDGQISELLQTFIVNIWHGWNSLSSFYRRMLRKNVLAFDYRLDHQIL